MNTKFCPLIKADCIGHACKFYIHLMGQNPQTGALEDKFDCAISWLPMLLVENASQTRKNSAAIEDFRNKAVGVLQGVGDVMAKRLDQLEQS